jgi:gliding motility-associated-like protein
LAGLIPVLCSAITPQCISVGATGDVTITWDQTGTSAVNFRSWHIYHSTSPSGPFSVIDSNNTYLTTTSNDPTANAANSPAYYVIAFKSNNGSADVLSDTIRAIQLNISSSGGSANISWNATHSPLNPNDSQWYLIYREYPAGIFTLLDSVDASAATGLMTYQELITICDDTIKYRIEVHNSSGCTSVSALKGDRFFDTTVPVVPELDSVSVDPAGNSIVSWTPSTSSDTREYIVFLMANGTVTSIDTVVGINSTTLSTTISATTASQTFFILALDSCNNISSPSPTHSTIFLSASFIQCDRSASLSWSAYSFWNSAPQYEILVSLNGGPETIAGTTTNTTFTDTNLTSGASMCYRIRATDPATGRTSTSNLACIAPSFPPLPTFCYIRRATVIADDVIEIDAYVDPIAVVSGYNLYRSVSPAGPYSLVNTVTISGTSMITFIDNIQADAGPYYYYLTTLDSCSKSVLASQVVQTMVLDAVANDNYTNTITWTEYSGWPTGVRLYTVYVMTDAGTEVINVPLLSAPPWEYIDSIINNYTASGTFCYVIEAIERNGNPYFLQDSARSNEVCVEQHPLIFIPNAFHPGGELNEIFIPSNAFVIAEGYSFDIFNRWGEHIFHTSNPREGWNGSYKGSMCPEGVYVYRVVAKNGESADFEKVGAVTLIR